MSTPLREQQAANLPLIATAGTDRTRSAVARPKPRASVILWIMISAEGPASRRLTRSIASWQSGHPELKTSIFCFVAIVRHFQSYLLRSSSAFSNAPVKGATEKLQTVIAVTRRPPTGSAIMSFGEDGKSASAGVGCPKRQSAASLVWNPV
jgi:hypothetical protein